jgi:hypothetical protein
VAEFFTSITGLGALIAKYGTRYDTRRAEDKFAPWQMTDD